MSELNNIEQGKAAYINYINSRQDVHASAFPTWEALPKREQAEWIYKANFAAKGSEVAVKQGNDDALLGQVRQIMNKYGFQCRDMADEIIAAVRLADGAQPTILSEFAKQPIGKLLRGGEIELYDSLDVINEMVDFEIYIHPQEMVLITKDA